METPLNRGAAEGKEEKTKEMFTEKMKACADNNFKIQIPEGEEARRKEHDDEWYEEFSQKLGYIIIKKTEGVAQKTADNAEESGVKGWIRIVGHYDQRQGTDVSAEMSRLIWTGESFGKAKN